MSYASSSKSAGDGSALLALQESLALSLAEAETERLRVQRLSSEVAHLKTVLRKHGIAPGDALESLAGGSREASLSRPDNSVPHSAASQSTKGENAEPSTTQYDAALVVGGSEARHRSANLRILPLWHAPWWRATLPARCHALLHMVQTMCSFSVHASRQDLARCKQLALATVHR